MTNNSDLQKSLQELLPPELAYLAPKLVALLASAVEGQTISNAAREQDLAQPEIDKAIKSLAGHTFKLEDTLLSFGQGSQIGDVTVNDLAGNNMNKFVINIYYGLHSTNSTVEGVHLPDRATKPRTLNDNHKSSKPLILKPVKNLPSEWICPQCGSTNHREKRFCKSCKFDRATPDVEIALVPKPIVINPTPTNLDTFVRVMPSELSN